MTEPIFSDTMEALWSQLPDIYRLEDAAQTGPDFPMKRWLSGVVDQLGEVQEVIKRIDFETADAREDDSQASSDLANPVTADAKWLPWIGQLVGLRDDPAMTDQARRDQVTAAAGGFRSGTKGAIAAAVTASLTGSRVVSVYDHSITDPYDGGGEWDVLIVTRGTETPVSSAQLIANVIAAGAKPAGVVLHHRGFEASWATIEGARPTWADWQSATWAQIEETGI
jgi:hypothetical protein